MKIRDKYLHKRLVRLVWLDDGDGSVSRVDTDVQQ